MKKKKKKWPIIVGVIVIIFIIFRIVSCGSNSEPMAMVTTTDVTKGDLQDSVSVSGTVAGQEKKTVFAGVSGRIEQVNVTVGESVSSGDVLVTYDMEAMDKQMRQAQLQYNKSNAAYNSAMAGNSESQAKLNEAKTNLAVLEQQLKDYNALLERLQNEQADNQRYASTGLANQAINYNMQASQLQAELAALKEAGQEQSAEYAEKAAQLGDIQSKMMQLEYQQQMVGTSESERDLQKKIVETQKQIAEFEEYKMKMESQKASSEATIMDSYDKEQYAADKELFDMNYQETADAYNKAKEGITAVFDGVVTECNVVPGAMLSEGMQVLTIESTEKVKVSFSVTKSVVEKLEIGQKAEVTIFDRVYDGKVSKINRMAITNAMSQSSAPMVGVEVEITNADEYIILGLDAKILIYTQKAEDALLIPVEAINADKESDFVYVVENGIAVRRDIVCGISSDEQTQVLEGLAEGDTIVLSTLTTIEDGMAVTIMPDTLNMADLQALMAE